MSITIKVTDVSAEVFHSMQNISKTSEKERKKILACYTDQKLKQTVHTECEKLNVFAQEISAACQGSLGTHLNETSLNIHLLICCGT